MPDPAPPTEFTCKTCGSPIPTTAPAGTQVTCNCCGAINVVPAQTEPSSEHLH